MTRRKTTATAIITMAVLLQGFWLSGCVTPRRIDELDAHIQEIKAQNAQTQQMMTRIDTTVAAESEGSRQLRADMQVTIDQLQTQISSLQANYNDLLQQINDLTQALQERRLLSSPGATGNPSTPVVTDTTPGAPPTTEQPSIDCNGTYDDAFVLVRRAEYEKAIEEFQTFIDGCPGNDLIENAYYWIGESYYSLEKYPEAIEKLQYLINNFKSSPNIVRALYKLGRSEEELGKKADAKQVYQKVINDYPGTLEAERAKERLKAL